MKSPKRGVISHWVWYNILGDFSLMLLMLYAMFRVWMGHYIGTPIIYLSVIKLRCVFLLFPWLMQLRMTQSTAIIYSLTLQTPHLLGNDQPGVATQCWPLAWEGAYPVFTPCSQLSTPDTGACQLLVCLPKVTWAKWGE